MTESIVPWIEFLILGLAVWRLSSLLVYEEGPTDFFLRFRRAVGVQYDEYSNRIGENEFARMLICLWCTSVWVGIIAAFLYEKFGEPIVWMASPFALSAVAIIIERIVGVRD